MWLRDVMPGNVEAFLRRVIQARCPLIRLEKMEAFANVSMKIW